MTPLYNHLFNSRQLLALYLSRYKLTSASIDPADIVFTVWNYQELSLISADKIEKNLHEAVALYRCFDPQRSLFIEILSTCRARYHERIPDRYCLLAFSH